MSTHVYYVTYSHPRGFGACEARWPGPIDNIAHIHSVADQIQAATAAPDQVIILTFQLLRTEDPR